MKTIKIPDSVTSIGMGAFNGCEALTDIYYDGSEDQWALISISEEGNDVLQTATIHYNQGTANKAFVLDAVGNGNTSDSEIDQTYNPESENAQSGIAVAEVVGEVVDVVFGHGTISGTAGTAGNNTDTSLSRGRTGFINVNDVISIIADSGYTIYIHFYDDVMQYYGNTKKMSLGTLKDGWVQSVQISDIRAAYPKISYVRISLKNSSNTNFTTGDVLGKVRLIKSKSSRIKYESFGLPCVYLMGDVSEMSKETKVTLNFKFFDNFTSTESTAVNEYTGQCSVKWQGTSSVRRGYPKRNYTIKFDEAIKFKQAWGAQNKYCLKANWIDPSAIRNISCANRWATCVNNRLQLNNPTDYATLPLYGAPKKGAVDGFPIILYINGEFEGLYTFNIPKDAWTFNMGSGSAEYIVGAESNSCTACGFLAEPTFTGDETQQQLDFSVEYAPDGVEDSTVIESFKTMVNAVKNAPDSPEWEAAVAPYLDIESAIDYLIFTCCIGGYDNTRKNILYATYDGIKWIMSAYDMDATFGMGVYGDEVYAVNNNRNTYAAVSNVTWNRLFYLIYTHSRAKLVERHKYLRNNIISDETMWNVFSYYTLRTPRIVYEEDFKKWATMPSTSIANMHNYMDYYRMHCAYLDKEIEALEATLTDATTE